MSDQQKLMEAWNLTEFSPLIQKLRTSEENDLTKIATPLSGEFWKNSVDSGNRKKVIICSDERVQPNSGEFKVGIAGQLILSKKEDQEKFISELEGKISAVRSHSGCGAANMAFEKLSDEEKNKICEEAKQLGFNVDLSAIDSQGMSEGDRLAVYFSYILARKLGAEFQHIPFASMRGDKGFHDARVIFFSANPSFDPSEMVDNFLPPSFLANAYAFGLNENYCKEELKILSSIALGGHGFGELFNAKNPFIVVSVGKDEEETEKMDLLAKESLAEFGDRIRFLKLY